MKVEENKKVESKISCHSKTAEQTLEVLDADRGGLSSKQVLERQKKFGKNILPEKKAKSIWIVILHQLKSPLIYILMAAGVVSIVVGDIKDAVFIFFVIFLNSAIGTAQEWKAEKSAESLQDYLKVYTKVLRDGREKNIDAEELVPGDIVLLESGSKVPADLRLISVNNLTVDESLLTGESKAVKKNIEKVDEDTPVSDCTNMVFAGSTTSSGRGKGVVVSTGLLTEVGKIAEAVYSAEAEAPPLLVRMEKFSKQIGLIVLGASVLLAVIAVARGFPYMEVFLLAVALAVSAIPEGLPVAITVALSIGTNRMAKRHVILRRLAAVESLGSCTLIASDKTGTLTVNKQTVKIIISEPEKEFSVTGEGYNDEGEILTKNNGKPDDVDKKKLNEIAEAVILTNEASLFYEHENWKHTGDAIDVAMLSFGYKMGIDSEEIKNKNKTIEEIPFDSEHKFSAKLYRGNDGKEKIAIKGAAEVILPLCDKILTSEGVSKLEKNEIEKKVNQLSEDGYRVIAVAAGEAENKKYVEEFRKKKFPSLTFLGLVGLIDPLRPDVKDAIEECRQAGIKVVLVTGDHPSTALFIARKLSIADSKEDVITGSELGKAESGENEDFINKIKGKSVFARVSPIQKLHIVEAFKKLGHFVAVTGDGVNDAPALSRANIGVAMGSGTDVTRDTASIIITDDSFTSIVAGVEEGRFAYSNIRKVTYLLVSTGAAEVILFAAALILGMPIALVAVQLLWLNLVTNGIQGVALAFEGGEPNIMKLPPRKPAEGIFNRLMIQESVISGMVMFTAAFAVWIYLIRTGRDVSSARNILLLLMVLLENFHVFNCRSEIESAFRVPVRRNIMLVLGVIAAQGIHIGSMYIPFMQDILGISPVDFPTWFTLLLIASSLLLAMEIFKIIKKRLKY